MELHCSQCEHNNHNSEEKKVILRIEIATQYKVGEAPKHCRKKKVYEQPVRSLPRVATHCANYKRYIDDGRDKGDKRVYIHLGKLLPQMHGVSSQIFETQVCRTALN